MCHTQTDLIAEGKLIEAQNKLKEIQALSTNSLIESALIIQKLESALKASDKKITDLEVQDTLVMDYQRKQDVKDQDNKIQKSKNNELQLIHKYDTMLNASLSQDLSLVKEKLDDALGDIAGLHLQIALMDDANKRSAETEKTLKIASNNHDEVVLVNSIVKCSDL